MHAWHVRDVQGQARLRAGRYEARRGHPAAGNRARPNPGLVQQGADGSGDREIGGVTMKSQARVVVIGGGVVGVSTLYHLTKKGWSDVVLIERKELTSGSTWHAAGLLPLFNMSYSVGQIHKYSVKLYESLERETGQHVGFKKVSNIRLASTADRMDEYRYYAGVAATIGVDVRFLPPPQLTDISPLSETPR